MKSLRHGKMVSLETGGNPLKENYSHELLLIQLKLCYHSFCSPIYRPTYIIIITLITAVVCKVYLL